jgi:hypothetical protein
LKRQLRRDNVIDPDWWCWQFDRAVRWLGIHIENELQKCKSEREMQNKLELLLGTPEAAVDKALNTLISTLGVENDIELPF